jgi:hypothetical protein
MTEIGEIVEAAARAMVARQQSDLPLMARVEWEDYDEESQNGFLADSRDALDAALAKMEEPTQAMLDAWVWAADELDAKGVWHCVLRALRSEPAALAQAKEADR